MEKILAEQIAYYQARAGEYDEWFYRQGRYDRGAELNQRWFDEVAEIRQFLEQSGLHGDILELAAGTGIWTEVLLPFADQFTVVDASAEMLAIHQAKLQAPKITYIQADLFTWQAEKHYDFVFFSFWLSHVPPEKLHDFLMRVKLALKPTGKVILIDSRREVSSTAKDHQLPEEGVILSRKLNDGREFTIVKVFYTPEMLHSAFEAVGLSFAAQETANYFIYGIGGN